MPENKKLLMLEKLTQGGSDDPFHWYALAIEYGNLSRHDDALTAFTALRAKKPDYVPMYLICGQMLEKLGRRDDARDWLTAGIAAAKAKGDTHAEGELAGA